MSNFLERLVAQQLGIMPTIRPYTAPRYTWDASPPADGIRKESIEEFSPAPLSRAQPDRLFSPEPMAAAERSAARPEPAAPFRPSGFRGPAAAPVRESLETARQSLPLFESAPSLMSEPSVPTVAAEPLDRSRPAGRVTSPIPADLAAESFARGAAEAPRSIRPIESQRSTNEPGGSGDSLAQTPSSIPRKSIDSLRASGGLGDSSPVPHVTRLDAEATAPLASTTTTRPGTPVSAESPPTTAVGTLIARATEAKPAPPPSGSVHHAEATAPPVPTATRPDTAVSAGPPFAGAAGTLIAKPAGARPALPPAGSVHHDSSARSLHPDRTHASVSSWARGAGDATARYQPAEPEQPVVITIGRVAASVVNPADRAKSPAAAKPRSSSPDTTPLGRIPLDHYLRSLGKEDR